MDGARGRLPNMNTMSPAIAGNNLPGILAMLGGSASFLFNDGIIKLIATHMPLGEIMAVRGAIGTGLLLAACGWTRTLHWPKGALSTWAFGLLLLGQLGSTLTFVGSLPFLNFADANGIQQFQPLAITAASAIFLKESVGWRRWTAALSGLIGVLFIIKPGTGAFQPYALLAASCVGFVVIRDLGTRAMMPGVPSLMLGLASAAIVAIAGLAMRAGETWIEPSPADWLGLAVAAVLLMAGYVLVIRAVRIAELSVVSPFRYASVLYALILQIAVWGIMPDALSLLGMAIVVAAGLYTFHREQMRQVGLRRRT